MRRLCLLLVVAYGQNVSVPFVVASLEAIPKSVQACSELVFSGAQSRDSRGQPLQFFWGFGPGTPTWFRTPQLSAVLEAATSSGSAMISISPSILSAGARSVSDLRVGDVRLEVRLTVRNALVNSTEAVASASVLGRVDQAEPVVKPVGSTELSMKHSDALHLVVQTSEAPHALQCANRDPGASAGRTNVTWQHRGASALAWQSAENLALAPNELRLAAYTLEPGSFHLFRAVAAFDTRPTLFPRPNVVFRVRVEPVQGPEVRILGPRLASQCGFQLQAEVWDPTTETQPEEYVYAWSCSSVVQVGEVDICAQLPHFGALAGNTDGSGAAGPVLRVDAAQLLPGAHRFAVVVRRASGGPRSIARNPVQVQGAFYAAMRMRFPPYGYTGVIDMGDGVPPVASVIDLSIDSFGGQCVAPAVHWQWYLVEDRLTALVERPLPTSSVVGDSFLELRAAGGSGITVGVPYYHVLLQAASREIMDEVVGNGSRVPLETVLRSGVVISAMSPKFVADAVPSGGSISVSPGFSGMSLRTTFHVQTDQWIDEDLEALEYEFLTFPFEAVDASSPMLDIDWDDPDSSRFWTALGGRRFRLFQRSSEAFLQATPGRHWVVVRARDPRGGLRAARAAAPLLVEAESNFSISDATALLARVEVTNDLSQLLEAIHAIAVIADPAVKVRTCSTDFFGTVTCEQIPSAEVVRPALAAITAAAPFVEDSDTLGKLGVATEGMIRVAFEPVNQTVDVTTVFGDSLNPGNATENGTEPEELEPVYVNVSRIQVLPEFLASISNALTMAHQVMAQIQAELQPMAAQQAWNGLVALLSALQGTKGDHQSLTREVRALINSIGALSLRTLPTGRELWLRTPPNNTVRADMMLVKVESGSDVQLPGLRIPRETLGRRLQGCNTLEVQVTDWYNLNPHFAAPRGFGLTDFLLPNSSIKALVLRRCGQPLFPEGVVDMNFAIDQPQGVHSGYLVEHLCAVFDEGLGAWSSTGVSLRDPVTNTSTQLTCRSNNGHGYFAAFYRVVKEAAPDTTTPAPAPKEPDEGLSVPAILGIIVGMAIAMGSLVGVIYACRMARLKEAVLPEEEEKEEDIYETETEEEVQPLPDPDPGLSKLRQAAEAGTLTAREVLARHSGPTGIRQELVWAIDKGYENKRREAAAKKVQALAAAAEERDRSENDSQASQPQVKGAKKGSGHRRIQVQAKRR